MHELALHAKRGPHLERKGFVAVEGCGQFVIHRGHVLMGARYGTGHCLSVIDVREPQAPTLVKTLKFKSAITSVALQGDLLFAAESQRALNLIDVVNPAEPDYFDCGVALGSSLYDVKLLDGYAAMGLNYDGLGLMDIRDPARIRWSDRVKLDEGFIERLVVAGSRIFAAGASGGLRVFEMTDGKLVEIARPCGEGFNASRVHSVDGEVWVEGTPEDGERQLVVIDPETPDQTKASHDLEDGAPRFLLPLGNGHAIGSHGGYTWAAYAPHDAWDADLFEQYTNDDDNDAYLEIPSDKSDMDDADRERLLEPSTSCYDDVIWAARSGNHLYVAAGLKLVVFSLPEGSIFREVVER